MFKNKNSKGQLVSIDMITAFFILVFMISVANSHWDKSVAELESIMEISDLEHVSIGVSESLIKTSGRPDGWGENNVTSLGLMKSDNVIDPVKLNAFLSLTDEKRSELLGLGGMEMNFKLVLMNDTVVSDLSKNPTSTERYMTIRRVVIYEDEIAYAIISFWRE